ncbi:hypothetical protein ACFYWS_00790 [Streptomyces sp. NPDC002795]|uniref:hypothetical protein n=1 Tax=Streptomyces sp. NPDC002795 TaxID=3364665 RepID=UPI0036AF9CC8
MNPSSSSPIDAPPTTTDALRGVSRDKAGTPAPLAELSRIDAGLPPGCETVGLPVVWDPWTAGGPSARQLAADYDLVTIDHADLGDAVAAGCLVPVDELVGAAALERWRAGAIGPAFAAYEHEGRAWAVPYVVTAQMSAVRADLTATGPLPATWDDVGASTLPLTMCLGGEHALLTLVALCLSEGERVGEGDEFVSAEAGVCALERLAALVARSDPRLWHRGPRTVLEALTQGDGPVYCPLIPGRATATRGGRHPLTFGPPPASRGVFAGTGLAASRRRAHDPLIREALRDHLVRLLAEPVQSGLFPVTGAQPAARAAWADARTGRRWGGFYRATLDTVETAWTRPNHPGYPAFQHTASELLRTALTERHAPRRVIHDLNWLYRKRRCI